MEPTKQGIMAQERVLFTVFSYLEKNLMRLRQINHEMERKLKEYKEQKSLRPKPSEFFEEHSDSQATKAYVAVRELILNPKVTKKVREA